MNLRQLCKDADYMDKGGCLFNRNTLDILKQIDEGCIDLIVSDIPYKTTSRGSAGNSGGMLQKDINKKGNVFKHNDINIIQYSDDLYRILKDGSHCYIMTNHVNLIEVLNTMKNSGFHFIKSLIWEKDNKIMGQYYMSQFEYILFFRKGKGIKINNCGTSDVLKFPNKKLKDEGGSNLHDTEKPVELMSILVENSSKEGQVVLDMFCGIGSTCIASKKLNRKYIGMEIDEVYFNIAKDRISSIELI